MASSASPGASVEYGVVDMHRGSRWGAVTGMSTAWSPLVRTRFATDNVEVAHDLIARMYANNTRQACGGDGSFSLEMSGRGNDGSPCRSAPVWPRVQRLTSGIPGGCFVLSRWESRWGSAGALIKRSGCCHCAGTWWLSMRPR